MYRYWYSCGVRNSWSDAAYRFYVDKEKSDLDLDFRRRHSEVKKESTNI